MTQPPGPCLFISGGLLQKRILADRKISARTMITGIRQKSNLFLQVNSFFLQIQSFILYGLPTAGRVLALSDAASIPPSVRQASDCPLSPVAAAAPSARLPHTSGVRGGGGPRGGGAARSAAAPRLETTPRADRIFCRRSSIFFLPSRKVCRHRRQTFATFSSF